VGASRPSRSTTPRPQSSLRRPNRSSWDSQPLADPLSRRPGGWSGKSIASDARIRKLQAQLRQVTFDGAPDSPQIHCKVATDQDVAHTQHLPPGEIRLTLPKLR